MEAALLGLGSALGLGIADFMARFSARALGASVTYEIVLIVGALAATALVAVAGVPLVWSPLGCAIAVLHGWSVAAMCILLYTALARGPIAFVAPIVASHPALVLMVHVLRGGRPSVVQWAAMAVVVVGGVLIARAAVNEPDANARGERTTLAVAFAACVAYAVLVLTGQAAAALVGGLETMWIGRWSGVVLLSLAMLAQQKPIEIRAKWLPYLIVQGVLDTAGYLALLAGGTTAAPYITMVVSSAFSVVTVVLARVVLREPISATQWGAISLIAAGAAILSGT
jgi:uncharacterized membrane protein